MCYWWSIYLVFSFSLMPLYTVVLFILLVLVGLGDVIDSFYRSIVLVICYYNWWAHHQVWCIYICLKFLLWFHFLGLVQLHLLFIKTQMLLISHCIISQINQRQTWILGSFLELEQREVKKTIQSLPSGRPSRFTAHFLPTDPFQIIQRLADDSIPR